MGFLPLMCLQEKMACGCVTPKRSATVRNSDVIMVLDHGNIIERGSHDELIAQKGEYYQLYTGAVELE